MKLKSTLLVVSGLFAGVLASSAANVVLFNVQGGPGVDTIWANVDGTPMDGSGFVTIGYFANGVTSSQIDTIEELFPLLGSFTSIQTAIPGTSSAFAGPGYLAEDLTNIGSITGANVLLGRSLYVIASDAANIGAATLNSGYSLFFVDTIKDDSPVENQYTGNPAGSTVLIGAVGSVDGDLGLGDGTTSSLQLVTVPEPSAALLGVVGALGLLRRRRN